MGTRNQKKPGTPLVYATSDEVNRLGAHIQVAAMLIAAAGAPIRRSATWKLSALVARRVKINSRQPRKE